MITQLAEIEIEDTFSPAVNSLEVFESLYEPAQYYADTGFPDLQSVSKVVKALENDTPVKIRWGVLVGKDPLWSAWRTIQITAFRVNYDVRTFTISLCGTDKLALMKGQYSRKTFVDATVQDMLQEFAEDYGLELDTDATSSEQTLLQCLQSDYEFIHDEIIPTARESLFIGGGEGAPSDFLFYCDKGEKLVVKLRGILREEGLVFGGDEGIGYTNFTAMFKRDQSQFSTIGRGVDYLTEAFHFREVSSDDLELAYDPFTSTIIKPKANCGRITTHALREPRYGANIDAMVKGEMERPWLFSQQRLAIPTLVLPLLEIASQVTVVPNYTPDSVQERPFFSGMYLLYSFYTMINVVQDSSYSISFMERGGSS